MLVKVKLKPIFGVRRIIVKSFKLFTLLNRYWGLEMLSKEHILIFSLKLKPLFPFRHIHHFLLKTKI